MARNREEKAGVVQGGSGSAMLPLEISYIHSSIYIMILRTRIRRCITVPEVV